MPAITRRRGLLLLAAAAILAGALIAIFTVPGGRMHPPPGPASARGTALRSAGLGQLAIAARYLGVSVAHLRSELKAGRSIAQAAAAAGKSPAGVLHALVQRRIARVERELAAHRLSRSAAERIIARIRTRAQERLERHGLAPAAHTKRKP